MTSKLSKRLYLSQNLRYLRVKLNLSQDKLANDLNISRNKIASYEGRSIEPKLSLISSISDYFKITIDDLITTKITDDNYKLLHKKYTDLHAQKKIAKHPFSSAQLKAIDKFKNETERIRKIVDAFKAFQQIRSKGSNNASSNPFSEVLDLLLESNRQLITKFNSKYF